MIKSRFIVLFFLFLAAVVLISRFTAIEAREQKESDGGARQFFIPFTTYTPAETNCRYGINLSFAWSGAWIPTFGAGHYINFRAYAKGPSVPPATELIRQVRLEQVTEGDDYLPKVSFDPPLNMKEEGLGRLVLANPGSLWIIGNEPDVAHYQQDNILPTTYPWAYHDAYKFIKKLDPTAQVANGGLSMMTPGRRQYMNIVWDTYLQAFGEEMPVDVWNMHLYILSEIRPWDGGDADGKVALGTNPSLAIKAPSGPPAQECPKDDVYCRAEHDSIEIFKDQILRMRRWMKNHGQENKPLILSEYSLLYPFVAYDDVTNPTTCYLQDEFNQCFTPNRVTSYMQQTLDYLETARDTDLGYPADDYRLVQQWAWFSMWTYSQNSGSSSNLLTDDYQDFSPMDMQAFSQAGHAYRARALGQKPTVNLVAAQASDVTLEASKPGGKADVVLTVGYYNDGSSFIDEPFVVTFFADELLQDVIRGIRVKPRDTGLINGCSWGRITDEVSIIWPDVPVGTHTYWAKLDGPNDIRGETNEHDNVISGQVTVLPKN